MAVKYKVIAKGQPGVFTTGTMLKNLLATLKYEKQSDKPAPKK